MVPVERVAAATEVREVLAEPSFPEVDRRVGTGREGLAAGGW